MGFYDKYLCVKPPTATIVAFTGAAPQQINGAPYLPETPDHRPVADSVYALVYAKATTNTLTVTGKWQISQDGVNWIDVVPFNNAANVALVTGTGAAVSKTVAFTSPSAVYGAKYSRFVLVSGVGSGGGLGVDEGSITYGWAKN